MADIQVYKRTPERDAILTAVPRRSHVPTKQTVQNVSTRREEEEGGYTGPFEIYCEVVEDPDGNESKNQYFIGVRWRDQKHSSTPLAGMIFILQNGTVPNYKYIECEENLYKAESDVYVFLDVSNEKIIYQRGDADKVGFFWVYLGAFKWASKTIEQPLLLERFMYISRDSEYPIFRYNDGMVHIDKLTININGIALDFPAFDGDLPEAKKYKYYYARLTLTTKNNGYSPIWNEEEREEMREQIKEYESTILDLKEDMKEDLSDADNYLAEANSNKKARGAVTDTYATNVSTENTKYRNQINSLYSEMEALDTSSENYESQKKEVEKKINDEEERHKKRLQELWSKYNSDYNSYTTKITTAMRNYHKSMEKVGSYNSRINAAQLNKDKVEIKLYGVAVESVAKMDIISSYYQHGSNDMYCYVLLGIIYGRDMSNDPRRYEMSSWNCELYRVKGVTHFWIGSSCVISGDER